MANVLVKNVEIPHDGNWMARFQSNSTTHPTLAKTISGTATSSLYVKADLFIPQVAYDNMATFLPHAINPLNILEDGDPLDADNAWARFKLVANSGVVKAWDDLSDSGEMVTLSAETWHTIECGIRLTGGVFEVNFGVDGTYTDWDQEGSLVGTEVWSGVVIGSYAGGDIGNDKPFYLDNIEVARDNWVEQGGTVVFSDNFNSGNFSAWTLQNTPTIAPNTDNTLIPTTIYMSCDVKIPAAEYATMVSTGGNYKHYFMGIAAVSGDVPDDALHGWEIVRSGGSLYFQDYWEFFGTQFPIVADQVYQMEIAIRPGPTATQLDFNCRVDEVEGSWTTDGTYSADIAFEQIFVGSFFEDNATDYVLIDNVKVAVDDWISEGGTPIFSDDFETGDTSNWDSTVGTPTVIPDPGP